MPFDTAVEPDLHPRPEQSLIMSPKPERESMRNMVTRAMIASLDQGEAEEDEDIRESEVKVSLGCKAMLMIT